VRVRQRPDGSSVADASVEFNTIETAIVEKQVAR
jgi:hypothetical protein